MEDQTLWSQFLSQVLPQLIATLGAALGLLVAFLRSKTGKAIHDKIGNEAVAAALKWAADLAFELVMAAAQTEIAKLKEDLSDGKVTSEEYRAQLQAVKESVVAKLRDATMGRLLGSGAASNASAALQITDTLVESAVKKAASIPNPSKAQG